MDQSTEFNDELLAYLKRCLELRPEGRRWKWAMTHEWWNDVRALTDKRGRPLFDFAVGVMPTHLFGYLVEARDDGGAPHLEAVGENG